MTAVYLAIFVAVLSAPVCTLLKGKPGLLFLGVLVHPCWLFGAIRLAKPGSIWARRFYDDDKLFQAQMRFSKPGTSRP
jgi:hypothetical protein